MNIFASILTTEGVSAGTFFTCTAVSLLLGVLVAVLFGLRQRSSRGFWLTVCTLPAIVQMVIMMVNGNIGAGVAVAGAFALVRFRSIPGTAEQIMEIFLAMAVGLATGMGYVVFAAVFALIVSLFYLLLERSGLGAAQERERILRINIPESLDYEGVFEDIFAQYTTSCRIEEVKTTAMGTLYRLTCRVVLRQDVSTREFLDAIRTRNGNLEVSLGLPLTNVEVL